MLKKEVKECRQQSKNVVGENGRLQRKSLRNLEGTNDVCKCIITLHFFNVSKEKTDQGISVVLNKLVEMDIEKFCSIGVKTRLMQEGLVT